jgi:hypothetical protein
MSPRPIVRLFASYLFHPPLRTEGEIAEPVASSFQEEPVS